LKRNFSTEKYVSVATITSGIIVCTLVSTDQSRKSSSSSIEEEHNSTELAQGLIVMTIGLLLSSLIGICQEKTSLVYGKHPMENLFLHHAMALPCFYFLRHSIAASAATFGASEPVFESLVAGGVPIAWVWLAGNLITQYVCIRSVFILSTECPSLTVTLVVTLRKFFSLLVSVVYFKTFWGVYHWIGTVLVFGGTLLYAESIVSRFVTGSSRRSIAQKRD